MKTIVFLPFILSLALIGCGQENPSSQTFSAEPFTGESAAYQAEQRSLDNVAAKLSGQQSHDWDGEEAQEIKRQAFAECKHDPSATFCK